MAEVTNELIYEILKSIQGRMSNLEDRMSSFEIRLDSVGDQLRGLNLAVSASNSDIANIYRVQSNIEQRITRIERRLDLTESSVR